MDGLNPYQKQRLIDLKNRLYQDHEREYNWASIEHDKATEKLHMESARILLKISNEIEKIIYDK